MNQQINNNINNFLNDISVAGDKLNRFSQSISEKDKNIRRIVEDFNKSLQEIEVEKKENEFTTQLNKTLQQYKIKSQIWVDRINSYMDGKEFINQFEKSILFVVFGNVNVGKSSIGNFIAGSADELDEYYDEKPSFFVYDFANNSANTQSKSMVENKFRENYTEETSTIQYYTLKDGLTWVDSPGIHSINGENEALAKKYVDYADLVLFAMSSSSPAKYDEFVELNKLMNKKKPLLVVINKSDKLETDEVDGRLVKTLVAKSKADRAKQEAYVKSLFEENNDLKSHTQSLESLSLSVSLAKHGLAEDNYDKFIDSGIPKFYDKLGETLRDNAIELKTKAPIQRVNSLIKDITDGFLIEEDKVDGLKDMKLSFESILSKVDESILSIKELKSKILKEARLKSMPSIDFAISKMSSSLQEQEGAKDIQGIIEGIILESVNETIQQNVSKMISNFEYEKLNQISLNIDTNLKGKYETFSYTEYSVKEVSRDPKGLIEHIGSWFGKEYTKIKSIPKTINKEMMVGDNSREIIENIILNLENELLPVVNNKLDSICADYFESEKQIINKVLGSLEVIKQSINKEIIEG